jgi:hypothetical protein
LDSLKGRNHLEDLGIAGRIILKWIVMDEIRFGGVDGIHLAQDTDQR